MEPDWGSGPMTIGGTIAVLSFFGLLFSSNWINANFGSRIEKFVLGAVLAANIALIFIIGKA